MQLNLKETGILSNVPKKIAHDPSDVLPSDSKDLLFFLTQGWLYDFRSKNTSVAPHKLRNSRYLSPALNLYIADFIGLHGDPAAFAPFY